MYILFTSRFTNVTVQPVQSLPPSAHVAAVKKMYLPAKELAAAESSGLLGTLSCFLILSFVKPINVRPQCQSLAGYKHAFLLFVRKLLNNCEIHSKSLNNPCLICADFSIYRNNLQVKYIGFRNDFIHPFLLGIFLLLIAPVTTFLWQLCLMEQLLWMLLCY